MPGSFYAQPAYIESVSAVTATPSVQLGSVRVENGEEYVYVYNDGGAQASQNFAVVPQSGSSGYSVTVTSVTGADIPMGFVKHATLTTATYGWAMVKGYTGISNGMASTALASGAMICLAANGAVQEHTGALTCPVVGKVIVSTASAGSGRAYVRCFGA
jgi:hypothetical protein